jgi:hypothetical protein
MGHVFNGYASLPKKSCFLACPIYCPVRNLIRHVVFLYVMVGFFQKSFYSALSMSLLSSHLCNWCVWFAKTMSMIRHLDEDQGPSHVHGHDPWLVCEVALTQVSRRITTSLTMELRQK